jgi:DNA-binding GntR family transcriptional regulator
MHAEAKAADTAADPEDASPRYMQIARDLKLAIADGRYPIGSRLPTEVELCAQFRISRFTAREALRLLLAAGLITRRQRVGTVVVAKPDEARYAHDASSIPDLLQYAQDTQLRLVYIGRIGLGAEQARDFGAMAGEEWIYALGIRTAEPEGPVGDSSVPVLDTRPFCITRVFLNPLLEGIDQKLRERKGAVYALIEREYKLTIARVEQELSGTVLGADDAANLGTPVGAPALRIVRRYYDEKDRLLEVADNLHPTDRFSYRMQLKR